MRSQGHYYQNVITSQTAHLLSLAEYMESSVSLNDKGEFRFLLSFVITYCGIIPKALSESLQISKAAVSKWANGLAIPTAPTRKAVLLWIASEIRNQAKSLESEIVSEQTP